jgi:alpha-L-fucosidase
MNQKTIPLSTISYLKMTNPSKSWFLVTLVSLFLMITSAAGLYAQSSQTAERSRWFREARVGMIIHWGVYSNLEGVWNGKQIPYYGEWIKDRAQISDSAYATLPARFNPDKFNADQWIQTASNAGMKYFCFVAKHHDGFTLWDTKENDNWNIMSATPFKRDIVKELGDACRIHGMIYSLYYSTGLDWHYPSSNWNDYKPYYFRQLKELLTNYGKIGYLWFDGEWTPQWNEQEAIDLNNYVHSIAPDVLTNNPKKKSSQAYGDFGIDEEYYSPPDSVFNTGLWERDRLVQENTWAYKSWEKWKTSVDMIHDMIDAASLSMNYCINIGPKGDGSFPPEAISILNDFGSWLKVNGEAIYKTTGFVKDITMNCDARITQSAAGDSTWYVHVFNWPASANSIKIKTTLPVSCVTALDPSIKLGNPKITRSKGSMEITIKKPAKTDPFATVIKLQTKAKRKCNSK